MKNTKLYSEINKLDKEHILYLVILRNKTEAFCKIGITSQTVEERMAWEENYQYTLIASIKGDGFTIRGLESVLKEQILDYSKHYQPKQKIGGYTECYDIGYCDSIEKAFKYIKKKKPKDKTIVVEKQIIVEKEKIIERDIHFKDKRYYLDKIKQLTSDNKMLEERINILEPEVDIWDIDDFD